MSINVTIAVPLSAVATIKNSTTITEKDLALKDISRAVLSSINALPYDIATHTLTEDPTTAPQTSASTHHISKSAAFASSQAHLDDAFTITVIHRSDAKPAAILKVHASTKVEELVQMIEDHCDVGKYAQYLVWEHKPFWDGARGTYDGDVTLGDVSCLWWRSG
jgi:hypothetical protein